MAGIEPLIEPVNNRLCCLHENKPCEQCTKRPILTDGHLKAGQVISVQTSASTRRWAATLRPKAESA